MDKKVENDKIQNEIDEQIEQRKSREKMMDKYSGGDFMRGLSKSFLDKLGGYSATLQQKFPIKDIDVNLVDSEGITLLNEMKFPEAIKYYDNLIKRHPKTARLWNHFGVAFMSVKNRKDALFCYDQAIQFKSKYYIAWYNKGAVYHECRQYKKAVDCFDKALEFNPTCGEAYQDRKLAREELGEFDWELPHVAFEKGINVARAQLNMGSALIDLGNGNDAIVGYHKLVLKDKDKLEDLYDAAYILEKHGKPLEALKKFEEALQINPQDPYSWFHKGRLVYFLKEDNTTAIDCFSNAIRNDPAITNPNLISKSFLLRSSIYLDRKEMNRGIRDLEIAESFNPFSEEVITLKRLFSAGNQQRQQPIIKRCPRCGRTVSGVNKYCYNCGYQFSF
jgi:tetratricopeptide (TPR) repeat protein